MEKTEKPFVCPYCGKTPEIPYVCGEYFVSCACSSDTQEEKKIPPCFHSSEEITIEEWNTWCVNRIFDELHKLPLGVKRFINPLLLFGTLSVLTGSDKREIEDE